MATFTVQSRGPRCDANGWFEYDNWEYALELLDDYLSLPISASRARLCSNVEVLKLIDSFMDAFLIRSLYFCKTGEICGAGLDVYTKILMLFMRLAIDEEELTDKQNHRLTSNENSLFNINRLFRAVAVFNRSNKDAVQKFVAEAFASKQFTEKDVLSNMKSTERELNDYVANAQCFGSSEFNYEMTETSLRKFLSAFEGLAVVAPLFFSDFAFFSGFLNSLAVFVEQLVEYFCPGKAMEMSLDFRDNFRTLLMLVDETIASAYALFHTVLSCFTSVDELYLAISDSLLHERFMFYYSIIYSVEEIIGQCDVQQKIFINDTLAHIRWTYTRLIIEQLRNRGQLADLGSPENEGLQENIASLVELLPDLSPHFIHLCLRHFGYSLEDTTNALLNIAELPLDLRALMSVELIAEKAPLNVNEALFNHILGDPSDVADTSKFTDIRKNTSTTVPWISLKQPEPVICSEPEKAASTAQNSIATAKEAKGDLRTKFGVDKFFQKQIMKTKVKSKSLLMETFDVPESEKVALRPTYERYRYEEALSSDYNLYDDEYDDTYDDRQNYDFDFREGDTAVLKGVEPNTNRLKREEIQDDSEEDDNYKEVVKSGARKKMWFKNNSQVNTAVPTVKGGKNNSSAPQELEDKSEGVRPSGSDRDVRRPEEKRKAGYTGGRDRQLKERHKGEFRRRQADKKMRGGMF